MGVCYRRGGVAAPTTNDIPFLKMVDINTITDPALAGRVTDYIRRYENIPADQLLKMERENISMLVQLTQSAVPVAEPTKVDYEDALEAARTMLEFAETDSEKEEYEDYIAGLEVMIETMGTDMPVVADHQYAYKIGDEVILPKGHKYGMNVSLNQDTKATIHHTDINAEGEPIYRVEFKDKKGRKRGTWAFESEFIEPNNDQADDYYIEYFNKDKGHKLDKKTFADFEAAKKWGQDNIENFNLDQIRVDLKKVS